MYSALTDINSTSCLFLSPCSRLVQFITAETSVTFQLLNNRIMVMAHPWPEKWNDMTRRLLFQWLNARGHLRSLLKVKKLQRRSESCGLYELELVWDVTDPQVGTATDVANLKRSLERHFEHKPLDAQLGNMMQKSECY
ncbi:hypothetical protein FGIG_05648 [Fasciola gigantica]|uniref:Uncharacterized protein n=1 Tax=Fasciola gigantica TaxID=46835 RepID=A0A504Y7P0_FASGI|nr:hypothetical protein FGIG_05648 [Fasciola gigantica]